MPIGNLLRDYLPDLPDPGAEGEVADEQVDVLLQAGSAYRDYWQAGKSVAQIHDIEPAGQVVQAFAKALGAGG